MGIRPMITYFWYVPKGYRKQHFHSLIAILKIDILIELFHNPWNPYYRNCSVGNVIMTPVPDWIEIWLVGFIIEQPVPL